MTNPMIGRRGASRYYDEGCREGFALLCRASRRVRETAGLSDVVVMIPFCRTLGEADSVLDAMAQERLVRAPPERSAGVRHGGDFGRHHPRPGLRGTTPRRRPPANYHYLMSQSADPVLDVYGID
ncbi:hypothetical protein ACFXA4_12685 [Streptomyces sp. NPDC059442]|uniref:hypothetical protein n=1 Tax=Streptomyces sp. NPDC059442 TaxID=3346830 RepID=UPI0036A15324